MCLIVLKILRQEYLNGLMQNSPLLRELQNLRQEAGLALESHQKVEPVQSQFVAGHGALVEKKALKEMKLVQP